MGGLMRAPLDGSGNAKSKAETTAQGLNTHGVVNRHPAAGQNHSESSTLTAGSPGATSTLPSTATRMVWPYKVGVSEDRNKRWRRTMEDAHAFVYDFGGVRGQGFFSVFDGHAGKHSAEWCGKHFHEYLVDALAKGSENGKLPPVPDILNTTFHNVDARLFELANEEKTSSGCTAVTCFLRLEDDGGNPVAFASTGGVHPVAGRRVSGIGGAAASQDDLLQESTTSPMKGSSVPLSSSDIGGVASSGKDVSSSGSGGIFKSFARKLRKTSAGTEEGEQEQSPALSSSTSRPSIETSSPSAGEGEDGLIEVSGDKIRRVLYTANVGDARAVLCRRGQAVRLTYDHKASDAQEAKRITDAGGFVMNNRVNAILAVTRSLGDSAMKEFVVGAPYTTETTLTDDDTFLIVACDGLWDVVDDQDAVDLVANIQDPTEMSQKLLQHALSNFSTDNTSVMVVRFRVDASGFPRTAAQHTVSSGAGSSLDPTPSLVGEEAGESTERRDRPDLQDMQGTNVPAQGQMHHRLAGEASQELRTDDQRSEKGVMTGYATTDSPETEPPHSDPDTTISQRQQMSAQQQSDQRKEEAAAANGE